MANGKKTSTLFLLVVTAPFFALYGAWVLVAATARLVRWAVWTARLTKPELRCDTCGFLNSLYGRWQCHAPGCGAVYVGAVDRCARCHAGASFFDCANCGVSILLRPGR